MDNKVAKELQKFIEFAADELGLKQLPIIYFTDKKEDKFNAFGHTKGADVHVRVTDRHPGDVMRTIAHELVHFLRNTQQNENVKHEDDANALAGRIMRKYNISNPKLFKLKPVESLKETESLGAGNSEGPQGMGSTSLGPIQGFDHLLRAGKIFKRKTLSQIIGPRSERNRDR